ncbi:hypothetical protein RA210_U210020 [Rubrivivax sp. A210]|nr:hypothetical protein RA210_U210020 [Rubrivivax sp. A210]
MPRQLHRPAPADADGGRLRAVAAALARGCAADHANRGRPPRTPPVGRPRLIGEAGLASS